MLINYFFHSLALVDFDLSIPMYAFPDNKIISYSDHFLISFSSSIIPLRSLLNPNISTCPPSNSTYLSSLILSYPNLYATQVFLL